MKVLTLIVHTQVQQQLTELLRSMDQAPGFTFTHVEGYGSEIEHDAFVAARDQALGNVPRIRTDILLQDNDVEPVLARLLARHNNVIGQGVYWLTPVEQGGHIL
jgi:nitrogen regulatory protein P-II 1